MRRWVGGMGRGVVEERCLLHPAANRRPGSPACLPLPLLSLSSGNPLGGAPHGFKGRKQKFVGYQTDPAPIGFSLAPRVLILKNQISLISCQIFKIRKDCHLLLERGSSHVWLAFEHCSHHWEPLQMRSRPPRFLPIRSTEAK